MPKRYQRHYYDVVEAKQIPPDPRLSDLLDISLWCDLGFVISPAPYPKFVINWVDKWVSYESDPGYWITKDENGCVSFFTNEDFLLEFTEVEENDDATVSLDTPIHTIHSDRREHAYLG